MPSASWARALPGLIFATLPDQGDGRDKAQPAKMTFTLDVKEKAPFMLWARYRPGYTKVLKVGVEIDGKKLGPWRLRAPYRPMGWVLAKGGSAKVRTWSDKIAVSGQDVRTLEKGRHTIALVLDPKAAAQQHAIAKLWATNDHSWRPPGYDPRANFAKRKW